MIDFTSATLTVSGLTFALALFRFDLLEVRPVARDRLFDELDDGVVVVGPNGRVREFNAVAVRVLEDIAIDRPAGDVLPSNIVTDGGELVVETATGTQRFRARSTALTDDRDGEVGRILYLHDVTEIAEREQRISVLNRILRHSVRNELNVATGHLDALEERATAAEQGQEHVAEARASVRRVLEFAENARYVERTIQESDTPRDVSAVAVTERVVGDAKGTFSDAVIECELAAGSAEAVARVVDGALFEKAAAELVENAVVHNDREPPQVTVRVEADAEQVRVSVVDDGPGIPKQERAVLTSTRETDLEHSSGLGLWLVQWTVSLSSGGLSFAENEPRGTIVTMTPPSDDE